MEREEDEWIDFPSRGPVHEEWIAFPSKHESPHDEWVEFGSEHGTDVMQHECKDEDEDEEEEDEWHVFESEPMETEAEAEAEAEPDPPVKEASPFHIVEDAMNLVENANQTRAPPRGKTKKVMPKELTVQIPTEDFMEDIVYKTAQAISEYRFNPDGEPVKPRASDHYTTAVHQSRCLRAAGEVFLPEHGIRVTLPECINGARCCANNLRIKGLDETRDGRAGFILMSQLSPESYDRLMENGTRPSRVQMCVLCERYAHNKMYDLFASGGRVCPRNVAYGVTRYAFDVPGGYNSEFKITGSAMAWEGLLYPIIAFDQHRLAWVKDTERNYWIDQSAIVHPEGNPPPYKVR